MPLTPWATHVLQWTENKEKRSSNMEQTSKKRSQFRLWAATRPHEDGVASNRESECRGECVLGSCTHRPSRHGSWECPKSMSQPAREAVAEGKTDDWGEVVTR